MYFYYNIYINVNELTYWFTGLPGLQRGRFLIIFFTFSPASSALGRSSPFVCLGGLALLIGRHRLRLVFFGVRFALRVSYSIIHVIEQRPSGKCSVSLLAKLPCF
jgi:hypothetical protein